LEIAKINYLLELMNNKTSLKNLTGDNKKAYKYFLAGIFINIINGKEHEAYQRDLYKKAEYILESSKKGAKIQKHGLNQIKSAVQRSMEDSYILNHECEDTTTKIIAFLRDKLNDLNEGKSLFQVIEFSNIIDVKMYFSKRGTPFIHNHHWVDFNLVEGLIHTTPVFILLNDLKIHWNSFIELINQYTELQIKLIPYIGNHEFNNILEIREIKNSYSGLYRTMIFTAVTFVEAFLLDVLINVKEVLPSEKEKYPILNNKGNITDEEILEQLLFKMYPHLKTKVNKFYRTYKEILNLRNRYVHASSYKEEHTNLSQLQYLLEFESEKVKVYLDSCIKIVKLINDELPEEIKSLYWWDRFEEPDFTHDKKVSLLNIKRESKKLIDYKHLL